MEIKFWVGKLSISALFSIPFLVTAIWHKLSYACHQKPLLDKYYYT